MNRKKVTSVAAAVLAGLVLFATDVAAQPTVTFQQNGAQVRVEWTPVAGATVYEVFVTGTLVGGPIPVPTTFFVVTAPPGTYILQIRGRNGSSTGPLSAPVTIIVSQGAAVPAGCAPVAAPGIAVATSGNVVTVSWPSVPGTIGYRLQVGTSPGVTQYQLDLSASQTSFSSPVPLTGTFYVRVLSSSGCGALAPSAEQSFTIGAPTPGPAPAPSPGPGGGSTGARTPDPPPGVLLPLPSYGEAVMMDAARRFAGDLANACNSRTYLFRLLGELRKRDTRWGLNYKRGQRGSLSTDIITYNPTNRPDNGESQVYLMDVVGAICEGNRPAWGDSTPDTWSAGLSRNPACGTAYCAMWTIDPYLAAGFPP